MHANGRIADLVLEEEFPFYENFRPSQYYQIQSNVFRHAQENMLLSNGSGIISKFRSSHRIIRRGYKINYESAT